MDAGTSFRFDGKELCITICNDNIPHGVIPLPCPSIKLKPTTTPAENTKCVIVKELLQTDHKTENLIFALSDEVYVSQNDLEHTVAYLLGFTHKIINTHANTPDKITLLIKPSRTADQIKAYSRACAHANKIYKLLNNMPRPNLT